MENGMVRGDAVLSLLVCVTFVVLLLPAALMKNLALRRMQYGAYVEFGSCLTLFRFPFRGCCSPLLPPSSNLYLFDPACPYFTILRHLLGALTGALVRVLLAVRLGAKESLYHVQFWSSWAAYGRC